MLEYNVSAFSDKKTAVVGYSGHAYVVIEALLLQGYKVLGYFDNEVKSKNPYCLDYLGSEKNAAALQALNGNNFIVAIGDNILRRKIYTEIEQMGLLSPCNALHPRACISSTASLAEGICVLAGAAVNPLAVIGNGVIINTGAIVEHECRIGDFTHIAPGAVLAGNVKIGENTFVGANSVIKQNISIGNNVLIGAGSVIIKDIPDASVVYGNPGQIKV